MAIDPRKLRPGELTRLLNSTPLGEVISERQLHRHRSGPASASATASKSICSATSPGWSKSGTAKARDQRRSLRAAEGAGSGTQRRHCRSPAETSASCPRSSIRERKAQAASDFRFFCETYFPLTFHLRLVARPSEGHRQDRAGGAATAACSRWPCRAARGKTHACAKCACIWAVLYGHRDFVCLIGSDEGHAEDMLESIKMELDGNDCCWKTSPKSSIPIQCLDGIANRCNGQLYQGERTHIGWTAKEIVLPTIPGSTASGRDHQGRRASPAASAA